MRLFGACVSWGGSQETRGALFPWNGKKSEVGACKGFATKQALSAGFVNKNPDITGQREPTNVAFLLTSLAEGDTVTKPWRSFSPGTTVEGEEKEKEDHVVVYLQIQPDVGLSNTGWKFCAPCSFQVLLKWIFSCNHTRGILKGGLLQANVRKFCTLWFIFLWGNGSSALCFLLKVNGLIFPLLSLLFYCLFVFLKAEIRAKASRISIPFKCWWIGVEAGGGYLLLIERSCTWRFWVTCWEFWCSEFSWLTAPKYVLKINGNFLLEQSMH